MKKILSFLLTFIVILSIFTVYPTNSVKADMLGDLNNDGYISSSDYMIMQDYLRSEMPDNNAIRAADINGDGYLSSADVIWLASVLSGVLTLNCSHSYTEWSETGEYNCEGDLITIRSCSLCGKTEESFKAADTAFSSLDGKTVMFIGNSFIYYGYCVNKGEYQKTDEGYFYQHCKANGENVTVYDFVWGGKNLDYIYTNYLQDASPSILNSVDYVFMSEAGENNSALVTVCKNIISLFPSSTEFYYLCHAYTYQKDHTNIISSFTKLQNEGVKIVNWGQLAYNVWSGSEAVPSATLSYNKNSFIVNKEDSHHQNMLSGYITTLMAYCAVTGKSAVGQTYTYCRDNAINANYDTSSYISSYYNTGTTNFDKIFASKADMLGLQQLMDKYLEKYSIAVNAVGRHSTKALNGNTGDTVKYAGLKCEECIYCGKTVLSSDGEKAVNNMYISADTVTDAGYYTVKEYMTAGLGNVFYKTSAGWGRCGYASIQGMASACDGERSVKIVTDGTELYWKIKNLSAKYDENGTTVTSGESYISLIGYDMTVPVEAKGIAVFFGKYAAPTAFKVLGGTTGSDGTITWKVLSSFDASTDSYFEYDNTTKAYFADFDVSSIDCLQLAVISSNTGILHISEIELY